MSETAETGARAACLLGKHIIDETVSAVALLVTVLGQEAQTRHLVT